MQHNPTVMDPTPLHAQRQVQPRTLVLRISSSSQTNIPQCDEWTIIRNSMKYLEELAGKDVYSLRIANVFERLSTNTKREVIIFFIRFLNKPTKKFFPAHAESNLNGNLYLLDFLDKTYAYKNGYKDFLRDFDPYKKGKYLSAQEFLTAEEIRRMTAQEIRRRTLIAENDDDTEEEVSPAIRNEPSKLADQLRELLERYGRDSLSLELKKLGIFPEQKENYFRKRECSSEELKEMGNESFRMKLYDQALTYYDKALVLTPNNVSLFSNKAACHLSLGRFSDCINECESALKLDKNCFKAWLRKGRSHFSLGHITQAIEAYKMASKFNEQEVYSDNQYVELCKINKQLERIQDWLNERDYSTALVDIIQLVENYPHLEEPKLKHLETLIELDQTAEAVNLSDLYRNALSHNPEFYYMQGLAYLYEENWRAAKEAFNKCLSINPNHEMCKVVIQEQDEQIDIYMRAQEEFIQENFEKAELLYIEIIKKFWMNTKFVKSVYYQLAAMYIKLGQFYGVIEITDNFLLKVKKGENAKAYMYRAEALAQLGRCWEALSDFQRSYQLEQNILMRNKIQMVFAHVKLQGKESLIQKLRSDGNTDKARKQMVLLWHPDKAKGTDPEYHALVREVYTFSEDVFASLH